MAQDTPYIPPGAEDEQDDVLGKLDDLLNRHRTRPQDLAPVPVLTDALAQPEEPADGIPTLTEVVSRPADAARTQAAMPGLEAGLVQRLAMLLEVERARLAAESAADPARAAIVDEMVARLRESLADIVRIALGREGRKGTSGPESREP
jgi:hypothetical protein